MGIEDSNMCQMCDTCPMATRDVAEYQELHVTVRVSKRDLGKFDQDCRSFGGKALTIELGLDQPEYQTMSSIAIRGSRQDAMSLSDRLVDAVSSYATVERVKMEHSIFHEFSEVAGGYFEGHFAVTIPDADVMALREVSLAMGAHCSKNAFKEGVRMVTYRHQSGRDSFLSHMDVIAVSLGNWLVTKRIHEYCYHDTNANLDTNWVSRLI